MVARRSLTKRASLTAHRGRTVAFVGFSNLSRNAKDAWLAPALSEMLGAELSVADNLQVVPDELVRDASLGPFPARRRRLFGRRHSRDCASGWMPTM